MLIESGRDNNYNKETQCNEKTTGQSFRSRSHQIDV